MDGMNLDPLMAPLPAHSELGASSMERWSHCPGSFALSRRERHRLPTIHAATGTVAHDLVERTLIEADPLSALQSAVGREYTVDGHVVPVDAAMTDGVALMLTYVRGRVQQLGVAPLVEQIVFVDGYFPPEAPPPVRMFGRADCQFRTPDLLEIVDYKNGSGVLVNVTDNPQLLYYAAGALWASRQVGVRPLHVKLTVVQPNARSQEKIRSYDLTALDVLMWVAETLIPAVRACEDPDATYNPGSWCGFCPVAHACPALLSKAQEAAKTQFDDSAEGATLANNLALAEHVELWVTALRGFALERAGQGLHIPGWGVVPTRPRRVWTDPDAVARLLQGAGITPFKSEMKSPAQIEKSLVRALWEQVSPFVESRSGGVKIARTGPGDGSDQLGVWPEDPA
jgi:hypothetical protein